MRRLLGPAVLLGLATLLALLTIYRPSLSPPRLEERQREVAVAKGQVLVDTPKSVFIDGSQDPRLPSNLAMTYALFLKTDGARAQIAEALGLKPDAVAASGPFTELLDRAIIRRELPTAAQVKPTDRDHRIVLDFYGDRPVVTIYGQAPTPEEARKLVEATIAVLTHHVAASEREANVPEDVAAKLRPLGVYGGGVVDPGINLELAGLIFLLTLGLGGGLLYHRERVRRRGPPARRRRRGPALASMEPGEDDWPRTYRLLPWSVAAFLVMIFLVPFHAITLPIPIPMDGKLDRPVLGAVIMLWVGGYVVLKGPARPKVIFTRMHVAALAFLALACLGMVLNATGLIHLGEFTLGLKKLVLLGSYIVLLFVVASVVRPSEVPMFAKLIIGVSVLTALGTIAEYRFGYNVFYDLSDKLLPGDVAVPSDMLSKDAIGRLTIYGPGGHALEVATLLGMAMPFAVVEALRQKELRGRVIYGLVLAILLAGALSTEKKTAVVAPVASLVVLAAYRPTLIVRRLIPMGLVLGVLVAALSPGAVQSVFGQLGDFNNSRSTQDRTADYDGVTPDVTSHLLMGRGFQTYDHTKYRILDNEYLGLIVGVGLIGLLAYLAMIVATMSGAHALIRGRDPTRADLALACSGSVAVFAVATLLFDILARPHVAYLFFFLGGLVAVLRQQQPAREPARRVAWPPVRSRSHAAVGEGRTATPNPLSSA
jgi:O-antigen ligase/polysaccharide polymerase Wzy-like membrane protein